MNFDFKKAATAAAQVAAGLVVLGAAIYAGGKLGQAFGFGKGDSK